MNAILIDANIFVYVFDQNDPVRQERAETGGDND